MTLQLTAQALEETEICGKKFGTNRLFRASLPRIWYIAPLEDNPLLDSPLLKKLKRGLLDTPSLDSPSHYSPQTVVI